MAKSAMDVGGDYRELLEIANGVGWFVPRSHRNKCREVLREVVNLRSLVEYYDRRIAQLTQPKEIACPPNDTH